MQARPEGVAVADLNGDGLVDMIVCNNTINSVTMLLGDGTGSFPTRFDFPTAVNPFWVSAADLDGNGLTDLLVTNQSSNTVGIYLNNSQ